LLPFGAKVFDLDQGPRLRFLRHDAVSSRRIG
jgi:hypothetical protein